MKKPVLHLMVGLPGSGKTTLARQIEQETLAIRLTPDEWQIRLFGDDALEPEHDQRHTTIEEIMWELAQRLLKAGTSVILDYGFWVREERRFYYEEARRLKAHFQVHYMDLPAAELLRRVALRNENRQDKVFTILPEQMTAWMQLFQPVSAGELREYADLLPQG